MQETLLSRKGARKKSIRPRETIGENPAIERRPDIQIPPGCNPESILLSFPVPREQAGQRLDRFIQRQIPRLSRTRANEIVRACAYRHDGRRRRPSERVRYGEVVLLVRPPIEEPATPQSFGILYEDASVMVVDKPAGLPMHPTATYHKNTLTYMLRERYGPDAPHICHRLDRETSGVVICAKGAAAERRLKGSFERRKTHKRYLAIVRGELPDDEGTVDQPMGRAREGLHVMMEARPDGSPATTHYQVVERRRDATLVALWPESGRQHQLRVHMAVIGHPILGDKLYGPEGCEPFLEYCDRGMTEDLRRRLGHDRHALHAQDLTVPHPETDEPLTLRSPLPEDMWNLWQSGLGLGELCGGGLSTDAAE